jgi:mitochondrial enoyl-[acyl-carrier protein] reductase / trans-2-enoyl-CoA reductase
VLCVHINCSLVHAGVYNEKDWHKVPADIRIEDAATASVNPATALSMLEKFEKLQPGDVVVQNGANSAVGKHVIQMCKHMNVHTVNVVRDRPDLSSLEEKLKALGADLVATPDTVREKLKTAGMQAPRLALNCVGGESATTLSKMLMPGGTLVTYGGMSMQPVSIPTPVLIFKDIKVLALAWSVCHDGVGLFACPCMSLHVLACPCNTP